LSSGSVFCALGIIIILYGFKPALPLALLSSTAIASLGIVLLHYIPARIKQTGLRCLALGLGLILGYALHTRNIANQQHYFKAYNEVSSFSGYAYKDSVSMQKGGFIHYIQLKTVVSETKNYQAAAAGRVRVLSSAAYKYYAGEQLTLTGKLKQTNNDPETHFICYPDNIRTQGFTNPVQRWRASLLIHLTIRINDLGFPAAALFNALFLGAKEELTPEMSAGFKNTGTLHILALSGLHVGIIYLLIMLLLLPLPGKRLKIAIGCLCVLCYLFVVGPMPSLLRAAFMLVLFALVKFIHRQANSLNILAIAAICILLIDPLAAYSVSFQLSFLALLGMLLIGSRINKLFAPFIPQFLLVSLALSIGAQFATSPVVLINFGIIYLSGIIVTLLLTPLITGFMWIGIGLLLFNLLPIPQISYYGGWIMNLLYTIIFKIADFFAALPGIPVTWQSGYWLVYGCLFTLLVFPNSIRNLLMKKLSIDRRKLC